MGEVTHLSCTGVSVKASAAPTEAQLSLGICRRTGPAALRLQTLKTHKSLLENSIAFAFNLRVCKSSVHFNPSLDDFSCLP